MRRTLSPAYGWLSLGIVLPFIAAANAADMDLPTAPKPAAYSWTGCYVGAQLGRSQSRAHWDYTTSNPYTAFGNVEPQKNFGADFSQERWVAGGQAGCNYQLGGRWVVGLEASGFTNPLNETKDNHFDPFFNDVNHRFNTMITTDVLSVTTVTGRLGFAVAPDWLVYGKGGFAAGRIKTYGALDPANPAGLDWKDTQWHTGWTAGGGFEYRLFRNVTIGAEYAYVRLNNKDHVGTVAALDTLPSGAVVPANPVLHGVSADIHSVMARINFYGLGPAAANVGQSPVFTGTFSSFATSEVKFASWTGTRGSNVFAGDPGKGYQIYSPTTVGINYDLPSELKVEARFKGGYVYARQQTSGQGATYDGPVDSQVSLNATLLNWESVRPTFGVAMNLPTGNAYLPYNQRFARMDTDLVEVGAYGAGFNVNPTAGLVFGLNQSTALSVSAGYAWQGEFTREGIDLAPENGFGIFDLKRKVNPGDVFTGNANLTTSIGKAVLLTSFAYMSESQVTIDGLATGRNGARYISNAAMIYQFDDQWSATLNGSWSYQGKNEIPGLAGGLVTEPKNSNSNVVIGSIEPGYQVNDKLKLAVNYSVLWRDHNYYDPVEAQFVPAKLKNSVGGSIAYAITPTASIEFRGSHAWIRQDTGPLLVTSFIPPAAENLPPSMKFQAWFASIAATGRF